MNAHRVYYCLVFLSVTLNAEIGIILMSLFCVVSTCVAVNESQYNVLWILLFSCLLFNLCSTLQLHFLCRRIINKKLMTMSHPV